MRKRLFQQVDVFTDRPYLGNPVAVVLDADGLDEAAMQSVARWTNLSETTFVLPAEDPAADYRLRIFTPNRELPFAGHPTLGSAHAAIDAGIAKPREGRLVQQCGAGLVALSVDADRSRLWLRLPAARSSPLTPAQVERLHAALGVDCAPGAAAIDVGPVWITVRVASADALLRARPDLASIAQLSRELDATGVTAFGAHASGDSRYEVRSFAPAVEVPEDPVCGSGNGCVAAWLADCGERSAYVARQGRAIGRDGFISVRFDSQGIEIGGASVSCVRGEILA